MYNGSPKVTMEQICTLSFSACHMPLGLNGKPAHSWALTEHSLTPQHHAEHSEAQC